MAEQKEGTRESDQHTSPSRRRRFWLVLMILVAMGAVALGRFARLESVVIEGMQVLTEERVLEGAGLRMGASRLLHPAGGIAQRLQREPWVASAHVTWDFRQLRISLQEREPVGLLPFHDRYLVLDGTGVLLEMVESSTIRRLPVISGRGSAQGLRGQRMTDEGLSDALVVLFWMAGPLRDQVSEIHIESDRSLLLFMVGGAMVQWGNVPDGEGREVTVKEKLSRFGSFWQQVSKRKIASCRIDLRVDDKVIPSGCE